MDNKNSGVDTGFLGAPKRQDQRSLAPWLIAGGVVLLVIAGLLIFSSRAGRTSRGGSNGVPDPYASQLAISNIELSQSSNMAGSQITYVDGTVTNHGNGVVDGASVATLFHLAGGSSADGSDTQTIDAPLNLIRTRDPYVDIEPVSADPIKPGESKSFRLIFDHVSPEWDQQPPTIRIMQVQLR